MPADASDTESEGHGATDGNRPHPEDLRSIFTDRQRRWSNEETLRRLNTGAQSGGRFSAEARANEETEWARAETESTRREEPSWQSRSAYEAETRDPYLDAQRKVEQRDFMETGNPAAVEAYGPPAGFLRRLGAWIIDQMVLFIAIMMALNVLSPILFGVDSVPDDNEGSFSLPLYLLSLLIAWIYNGLMVGMYGATLGKRVFNIYVLNANGEITGVPRGFARAAATAVSAIILYIGFLMVLFREDRRALHDLIADTYPIELMSRDRPRPRS